MVRSAQTARWLPVLIVLAAFPGGVAAGPAELTPAEDSMSMLYLEASDWRAADKTEKDGLASAFMRVFCTDLRMPPSALVACLDSDGDQGRVYERAIACIEKAAGRS